MKKSVPTMLVRLLPVCFCASLLAQAENAAISLDQYLRQVQGSNEGYVGADTTRRADDQASQEADLPFSTQFFSSYQHTDDNRQTIVPIFEGTRTLTDASQVGFKKQFDFGLQSQLSYNVTGSSIYGVSPQLVPENNLVTSSLMLQLTQSLWQNGFGKADRANRQAVEAQDRANSFTSSYQMKTTLSDAESRYWSLAVARELVTVQRASTERTIAIRDFNARRARAHLIDESDLLTSEAQAKSKQFDLKTAIDNERAAARSFNSARSIDSDSVEERLVLPGPSEMVEFEIPVRDSMRDDVKSAQQLEIAAVASSESATQKQLPTLNLVGTISTNGLDPTFNESMDNTLTSQYPYYSVGFNFNLPLDFSTIDSVKRAYAEQKHGAELTFRRKLFDQENDWKDLVKKFQEAKERLAIAVEVERAQELKFQHERLRQKQGATTTYQVFQYEIDYLTSQINRIQTQGSILTLIAQMKTYRSEP